MPPTFCSYTKGIKVSPDIWKHNTGSPHSNNTTAHAHDFRISNAKLSQLSKCNVYAICRQTQLSTRWYANLLNI